MIIRNGRVRFAAGGAGEGMDPATGYPAGGAAAYDEGVPCQYVAQEQNNIGAVYGERFRAARWVVYVDLPCAPRRGLCRVEDAAGEVVAEGEIVGWQQLDAVLQARIML